MWGENEALYDLVISVSPVSIKSENRPACTAEFPLNLCCAG
jgi:hypothetical protein